MSSPTPERNRGRFAADDWGLSPAVNEAILELAERGLLRSVSAFANLPHLELGLERLLRTGVGIAAHLNFTLGRPLSRGTSTLVGGGGDFFRFPLFVARGLLNRFDALELRTEAEAQLRRLRELCVLESANGHQHVHLLPWMIAPLTEAGATCFVTRWRRMEDSAHLPSFLASVLFRRGARDSQEPTCYLWPTGSWSPEALADKIARAGERPLLVHPATRDDFGSVEFADELRGGRVREFESLRRLVP